MKNSRTISRPEGYQANDLHEASLNTSRRGEVPQTIGSTGEMPSRSINADPDTPADAVNERDQEIQEEKIHDISEENDTMHNPDMELGKSYAVTSDEEDENDAQKQLINDDDIEKPEENPNKEYDYDDDKVKRSNIVA